MGKAILDARIYLAELDLSGVTNAAAINLKTDVVDCTAFSDAYRDKLGGMTDVICDVSGFFSASEDVLGNPDKKMFDQLALSNAVLTICPEGGALGTVAYFFRPTLTEYSPIEGKVSDMAAFKLHGEGARPLVKGKVLAAKAARTTTSGSTKILLGPYTSTQYLYGALQVFSASAADTLDVLIAIADRINTVQVNAGNPGAGYSEDDVLTVVQSGGSLGTLKVETVGGSGEVTGVSVVTPGSGYTVANNLATTVAPAGGSGCKIDILTLTDTTILSFAQKTAAGFEWKTDAGPITDVNFKAKWTIGGTLPSFTFAVVAGIV